MNDMDINHNSHFPGRRNFYSLSPLELARKEKDSQAQGTRVFIPGKEHKLKTKRFRTVVFFLVFFVLLSVVMSSMFAWQMFLASKTKADPVKEVSAAKSCVPLPHPVPLKTLPDSLKEKLKELEDVMRNQIEGEKGVGSMSANMLYRDRVIWTGFFGSMNKSESPPRKPTVSTVYPCASISKVITALSMYKLYNEKLVTSLSDPITKYEPDFKIKNPFNNHKITLKELASMRAGLQREAPCYPGNKKNLCPFDHKTMLRRIQNLSLLVEPGTLSQYSNFGYSLLGQVLATRFSRGDFMALAKRYVLNPLGMNNSTFSMKQSQLKYVPVAYDTQTGHPMGVYEWGWLNPGGGMFTTVNDLAKMSIELMKDSETSRFLSKAITEELFSTAYILPDGKTMTGTPWEMSIAGNYVYRVKGGSVFGYEGSVVMVPELRLGFNVLCTNCKAALSKSLKFFEKQIVPTMEKELRKATNKKLILPPDYKAYVGSYTTVEVPGLPNLSVVLPDSNKLLVNIGPSPYFYLNYTSPCMFRLVVATEKVNCLNAYVLGSENDLVIFDEISNSDGFSHGFTLFAAHPSGKSYFSRVPNKKA